MTGQAKRKKSEDERRPPSAGTDADGEGGTSGGWGGDATQDSESRGSRLVEPRDRRPIGSPGPLAPEPSHSENPSEEKERSE